MEKTPIPSSILVVAGIFTVFCAIKNYDWFMESNKAKFFVDIFGRDGARMFYIVLGFLIMVFGFLAGS